MAAVDYTVAVESDVFVSRPKATWRAPCRGTGRFEGRRKTIASLGGERDHRSSRACSRSAPSASEGSGRGYMRMGLPTGHLAQSTMRIGCSRC